jgi:hypothetical protein
MLGASVPVVDDVESFEGAKLYMLGTMSAFKPCE